MRRSGDGPGVRGCLDQAEQVRRSGEIECSARPGRGQCADGRSALGDRLSVGRVYRVRIRSAIQRYPIADPAAPRMGDERPLRYPGACGWQSYQTPDASDDAGAAGRTFSLGRALEAAGGTGCGAAAGKGGTARAAAPGIPRTPHVQASHPSRFRWREAFRRFAGRSAACLRARVAGSALLGGV